MTDSPAAEPVESGSPPDDRESRAAAPMGARRYLARVLMIIDVFATTAAAFAAGAVRESISVAGRGAWSLEILPTLALVPLLVAGFAMAGCYRPAGAGMGADTFRRFARGAAFGMLIVAFTSFALRLNFSRLYVLLLAGFLLLIGLAFRWVLRRLALIPSYGMATRVIVAGTDDTSRHLAATLDGAGPSAFEVLGYLRTGAQQPDHGTDETLGDLGEVGALVDRLRPDAVVASTSSLSGEELRELYLLLEPLETELIVYPSLVEVASRRLDLETAGPFPLLHLSTIKMTAGRRVLKRLFDLAVAIALAVLTLPLMLVSAVAIKVTSPGPVLFRQDRVGLDGDTFTLFKLRTMVEDAEEQLDDIRHLNQAGEGLFKVPDDPRVTRLGRWLRRWSIDELPQLFNVIAGDMSMVGPRPALPEEVDTRDDDVVLRRHRIKPGITGHWQVSGRSDVSAAEALRMDLYYVENWSLAFDLLIVLRTIRTVLTGDGAY